MTELENYKRVYSVCPIYGVLHRLHFYAWHEIDTRGHVTLPFK